MASAVLERVGYSSDDLRRKEEDLKIAKCEFIFHNREKRALKKKIAWPIVGLWPGFTHTYAHEYRMAVDSAREFLIRRRALHLMSKMSAVMQNS